MNQIHDRPMVVDGEIVARKMMYLSPSFDHRVIDGAVAARFVAALKAVLETPEVLLVEGLWSDLLKTAETELAALCPPTAAIPLGPMTPVVEGGFTGMNKSDWVVCGSRERIGAVPEVQSPPARRSARRRASVQGRTRVRAPGTRALHAVGAALGSGAPVLCILGSASAASGAFAEALNAALSGARVFSSPRRPSRTTRPWDDSWRGTRLIWLKPTA